MVVLKLDAILLLSSFFEKRALSFLKRAASFYPSSFQAISDLIGKPINTEELESWIAKNRSLLENIKGYGWRLRNEGGNDYLVAHDHYDDDDHIVRTYIGATAAPPQGVDVSHSGYLQGEGEIPSLWFFQGTRKEVNPAAQSTPELAHENWLINGLSALFGRNKDVRFLQDLNEFIQENKPLINKLRRHFTSSDPQVLGQGADGVALGISPNLVLKLFRTRNAYHHAMKAMDRLHKNPELAKTEAMIYDAGILGEFNNQEVYYYIIERMTPLDRMDYIVTATIGDLIYYISDRYWENSHHWERLSSLMDDPKNHPQLKEEIKKGGKQIAEKARNAYGHKLQQVEENLKGKIKSNWLETLAEEIIFKRMTNRTDLHTGNIGFTGFGDFRYFDPVYN